MIPQQWTPPCNNQCTLKYAALMQIPWRVFCKKGCDSDGETWEECCSLLKKLNQCYVWSPNFSLTILPGFKQKDRMIVCCPGTGECDEMCYKDPVLKDHQWSAYIDRSPGSASYSEECFHACVSGCGYKFDVAPEKVNGVHPNRPTNPPPVVKPVQPPAESRPPSDPVLATQDDIPCTSA